MTEISQSPFLAADLLHKCLVTCGVLMAAFHGRAECGSASSWSWRALRSVMPHHQGQGTDHEKTMQIRRMVDQARTKYFKLAARFAVLFAAILSVVLITVHDAKRYVGLLAFVLSVYGAGLFAAYSPIQWTPIRITRFLMATNVLMFARTWTIQDPGFFFLHANNRILFRLVIGITDMNYQRSAVWNLLYFILNSWKTIYLSAGLPVLEQPFLKALNTEASVNALLWLAVYLAEVWVTGCVRAAFEFQISHKNHLMANHLLSAFCDAQVRLGPDLQILGSHQKLSHILLGPLPDGHDGLQGNLFLAYLASSDRTRFKAFIEASAVSDQCVNTADECLYEKPKTLPSALHVHLCDSSGRHLPAEIFHSAVVTVEGESHHLIGICIDSPEELIEIASSASQPTEQSAEQPVEQVNSGHHQEVPHQKNRTSLSSRSTSSKKSTSSSMKRSMTVVDLPLISRLSLEFDPFEWTIRKVTFDLSPDDDELCGLDRCMLQPGGQQFRQWAQDIVNNAINRRFEIAAAGAGETLSTDDEALQTSYYGAALFSLPQLPCLGQTIFSAKSTWLDLGEFMAVEHDEYALISFHLDDLQQVSGSARPHEVMTTITESQ